MRWSREPSMREAEYKIRVRAVRAALQEALGLDEHEAHLIASDVVYDLFDRHVLAEQAIREAGGVPPD